MDNAKNDDSKMQLHSILVFTHTPHVLTQIFANLKLSDRGSVRLVCKNWYEACNAMKILAVEKLVYRNGVFGERVAFIQTIKNSSRKILNLEFVDVNFTRDLWFLAFWQKCGPKIRSLWFTDCLFSKQMLEHVILYSSNLQYLSLTENDHRWGWENNLAFGGYASLDELVNLQIRRECLSSIKVKVFREDDISSKWIQNLFTIHPNIKDFSLFIKFQSERGTLWSSENHIRFSILSQILMSMRTTFESIVLGSLVVWEFPQTTWETISHLTFPRLRKIRVFVRPDVPNQLYIDFFIRHPQLKFVIIASCFNEDHNFNMVGLQIQQIVSGLLQACVHLQSLKLENASLLCTGSKIPLPLDKCFFAKLLDSSLITFNYDRCLFDLKLPAPIPATCTINNNLRSLNFPQDPERGMTALLSRLFQGLTHLEVHIIDDDGLQSVLKFQNNLRSLILNNCTNVTEFGFTGYHTNGGNNNNSHPAQGYSMKNLCKLQYLCLKSLNCHIDSEKIFSEFNLPDLLHLVIQSFSVKNRNLGSAFGILFSNLPKLEGFSYSDSFSSHGGMDFAAWLVVCSRLKNLHLLTLHIDSRSRKFKDEACKLMFKFCPKLRFLTVNDRLHLGNIVYYYKDFSNHEIVKKLPSDDAYNTGFDDYGDYCNPVYSARLDTYTIEHLMYV